MVKKLCMMKFMKGIYLHCMLYRMFHLSSFSLFPALVHLEKVERLPIAISEVSTLFVVSVWWFGLSTTL